MKAPIPPTAALLFCLVALPGCKKKPGSEPPRPQTTLRAYSGEARSCARDSDCVVTNAWQSCCPGCLEVPRAWNRRAHGRLAAQATAFCRPARRRCGRSTCSTVVSDVLQKLDLFPKCLGGRCLVRWRKGLPAQGRDYLRWSHPGRDLDGKPLAHLPRAGLEAQLALETLRLSAEGDPRLMKLPDSQPVKYSNWSVLAVFWPLLEGFRIVLEGRAEAAPPRRGKAGAGTGLTLVSASGARLRLHWDRGVTQPKLGDWIRVEGLVVGHADRIPPLHSAPKSPGRAAQLPPQDPYGHLSLIRVHWNPAVAPKRNPR
ncbi:MAG: hypothetical protein ABI333_31045 [bacterium]